MSFIRAWNKHDLYTSLFSSTMTASGDITSQPTLLFYAVFTHLGGQTVLGSGAIIELFDGGTAGVKILHLESASGDRAPFGISLMKPVLCSAFLTLAATATGLNASFGYYNYSA